MSGQQVCLNLMILSLIPKQRSACKKINMCLKVVCLINFYFTLEHEGDLWCKLLLSSDNQTIRQTVTLCLKLSLKNEVRAVDFLTAQTMHLVNNILNIGPVSSEGNIIST